MSKLKLKEALPDTGRGTWRDKTTPGLELIGNKTGASWFLRYRVSGKRIRDKLGRWPGLDLNDARKVAKVKLAAVATSAAAGVNVSEQRAAAKAEEKRLAEAPTLEAALGTYDAARLQHQKRGKDGLNQIAWVIEPFKTKRPHEVKLADVLRRLDLKRETAPSAAAASLRVMKPFTKWLHERGYADDDILAGQKTEQTRRRARVLSLSELGQVANAVDNLPVASKRARGVLQTILATGQRINQVGGMRRADVDLDARLWNIQPEQSKNDDPHQVPLNDRAVAAIRAAMDSHKGEYVFGDRGRTPFSGWSKARRILDRELDQEGWDGWTWHDVRRTLATQLAEHGLAAESTCDLILNHKASATRGGITGVYQLSKQLPAKRQAMDAWGGLIDQAAAMASGENVVGIEA
ncbi:tyrosine-type recombinase/integrase [Ruegeria sp. HKCCD4884]|uniref:tyrosine-type recombinase/integrase n=1 Tax=Ruegeria sp. HKCCD4884 TaxID=2683022 RepID=UPI0014931924|nr:integrase family protein [Ruegeria sp. HKCCD4884]NOD92461.1 tyrosine-type recombinase/integrase [Ruegeria sp. HKCCD4884]